VAVDAEQLELGTRQDGAQGRERLAARDRHAELLVLVRRRDELVPAGVHPGGDPEHHRSSHAALRCGVGHPADLRHGVQDDPAHPVVEGPRDLAIGLVVAVQPDVRPGNPRPDRHGELARAARIEPKPLLGHPARDRGAQERLACVVDVHGRTQGREGLGERLAERGGPSPEIRLVDHPRGGPVFRRERACVHAPDCEDASGGAGHAHRPHGRVEVCHIRSGALTPSRASPFASTVRVASFNHNRVRWTSVTGSSPTGVTRRWSYHLWYAPASSSR